MAKEWILNMATNRWGLNRKNSVGQYLSGSVNVSRKQLRSGRSFIIKNLRSFLNLRV